MQTYRSALRAGTSLSAAILAIAAVPAMAQTQSPSDAQTSAPAADQAPGQEIVVTGSLFGGSKITPSPVTTITSETLDQRGISTIQDAVQQLSSNNGPALTNSFSANGAFAGGASAVSLRGMTTNSTLVLFDGMRAAYYPLADDGSRNFVDLNTIPDDIVDRIEVLRDGASSSYGADAIAGVVNIITKKQFKGLSGRVEAGVAEGGFGASQRLSLTAGTGDLDEKGYNAYISGFYYHSALVRNSDLKAPFNSDDKTRIGGPDDTINPGTFGVTSAGSNLYVAPGSGGRYQLLANNCLNGNAVASTAAQLADNDLLPSSVCRVDSTNRYGVVAPEIERFGASARFTANLNDTTQAFLALNFQQSTSSYTGSPSTIYAHAPTGVFYPQYSTRSDATRFAAGSQPLTLPVYVCAARVNCATAADGRLNPNNPFAATGDTALLVGALPNSVTSDLTRNRVYRAALGVTGQVFGWDYTFDATAMHSDLKHRQDGYVYIQHLLDVIADGSYNFIDPSANSAATMNYLMPQNITNASSDLYQAQLSFKKAVMDLPGGPLNVGFGGSVFYEAVDAPSANSDFNGPTERYFTINAFGTEGHRTVASAFGEVNAPILPILDLNLSGRYDHYSTGQSYFSPKVGAKLTPIRQLTVRGTWSRGFRIPSFAEANALPTTGYVNNSVSNFNDAYLAQYGCTTATFSACPTYIRSGSYGATTLATPDLKPEKSRSWTAGIYFEPIRNISFTVDYFNIKKTGAITTLPSGPAISAYYSGQAIPAGYEVIADSPDPAFPNAKPRIAFIRSSFVNANTIKSEGIDFGMNVRKQFGEVSWTSNLDATLQLELSTTLPDGTRQTYVDTLGNYNLTAGSGTFQWHGNWQNTIAYKQYTVSGTVNYTSGYDLSAMDQDNAYSDCGLKPDWFGGCRVKSYITFDLNAAVNVNDRLTVYGTVLNLFDRLPGVDPVTYGAYLYNPVQAGNGVYGRMFRAGAKFSF
ncbi:TonB-dependent receptor [Sphingomonas sp. ABOLD]|uniref:Iron complex outermembrane receptor protein n=1 Tax=Sphingomonas trueperi TaxID=53317 RepID=A0A7X5XZ95_9SPHN|nr:MULTISPECIES: TonB-dependent receptor [Sphingomonas]NJB98114.1 iron complex outermembrane receptor protein [Sphingomonas trueperi]RSV46351.1 TonB-dependent receptor [Sphingomonas sp. ABOLD]